MYKDSLFELIRKEEVIIWAGAGLSMYAGFPSGQRLGEILVENLSESEKGIVNDKLPLPDLAEEFYRLKGNNRNSLIRILKQTFSNIEPKSTECHNNLAIISHFKTIITTNYDTLIEDTFKSKAQVVLSSKHIPYLEKDKTHIFKVHGDLSEPDSIIITKSDYNNFFKANGENDIYWTVIKERLSTSNVLFLGYNLEDPNVSVIFDRITDALGSNRKECFLVAPSLPQHKVNDLIKKGVHYIDLTAEQLISELVQNIKEHIIEDLEKGSTSADTFRDFLSNIELLPGLKADKRTFKVHSLHGTNGITEGKMNFSVKNDPEFIKELNDYISGKKIGSFEISKEKLVNANFWYGGLKFPNSDGVFKLLFKSNPKVSTSVDIRFDDGSEFTDMPVKLYASPSIVEIHVELKNANLIINLDLTIEAGTHYKFNYKHNETATNVKDELELYTLLRNLGEGKRFTVFAKTGENYSSSFPIMKPLLDESQYFLGYFENYTTVHF